MLDFQEVIGRVTQRSGPRLVAIDGLPLAGKSNLADLPVFAAGAECIRLDDFVKPEPEWRSHDQPSFSFDFIRYDEFMAAVTALATSGRCAFRPYSFETACIESEAREVWVDRLVIVEGCIAHLQVAVVPHARL